MKMTGLCIITLSCIQLMFVESFSNYPHQLTANIGYPQHGPSTFDRFHQMIDGHNEYRSDCSRTKGVVKQAVSFCNAVMKRLNELKKSLEDCQSQLDTAEESLETCQEALGAATRSCPPGVTTLPNVFSKVFGDYCYYTFVGEELSYDDAVTKCLTSGGGQLPQILPNDLALLTGQLDDFSQFSLLAWQGLYKPSDDGQMYFYENQIEAQINFGSGPAFRAFLLDSTLSDMALLRPVICRIAAVA